MTVIVEETPKHRFLVCHDYGRGGSWWWGLARSAREIAETFAETWVIDDPQQLADAREWDLDEVEIDDLADSQMQGLRAQRDNQRHRKGFGVLADRDLLYIRQRWDEDSDLSADYLLEITDGYRTRQVEVRDTGEAVRTGLADFPINPPIDLWDPDLAEREITAEEFEKLWDSAVLAPEHWYD